MSDKKVEVKPGLSQEQIQNLKTGQTLRLVRKCAVREYSFEGDVEITEVVANTTDAGPSW